MAGIQWSQEQIILFLETFQSESVIWDPNERGHKDKKKINDAWMRIKDIMQISVEELKRKKESLIATYRGYSRKRAASIKSDASVDDVYRPVWFAFEYMDSFLGPVYKYKKTISADRYNETGPDEREEDAAYSSVPTTSSPPIETQTEKSETTPVQNRTTRRRNNPSELQIASQKISEAFDNLNKIINKTPDYDACEEDECDLFGKLIAKKLRKLPDNERDDLMLDIHALFKKSRSESNISNEKLRSSTPDSVQHPTLLNIIKQEND